MPIERKYERDIDLLLAEEFSVSPAFSSWFVSLTTFARRASEPHVAREIVKPRRVQRCYVMLGAVFRGAEPG